VDLEERSIKWATVVHQPLLPLWRPCGSHRTLSSFSMSGLYSLHLCTFLSLPLFCCGPSFPPLPSAGDSKFFHCHSQCLSLSLSDPSLLPPPLCRVDPMPHDTPKPPGYTRFVCISDTHSRTDSIQMPYGDVFIHAGDFTELGLPSEVKKFNDWLGERGGDQCQVKAFKHPSVSLYTEGPLNASPNTPAGFHPARP